MALFIATITGDFGDISGLLVFLATNCGCSLSSISLNYSRATVSWSVLLLPFSLVSPSFLFFSGLFLSLCDDL